MPPNRKVSSIICDSDLWMRAKIAARQAPMTLGEWIEDAMRAKLEQEQKTDKLRETEEPSGETRA